MCTNVTRALVFKVLEVIDAIENVNFELISSHFGVRLWRRLPTARDLHNYLSVYNEASLNVHDTCETRARHVRSFYRQIQAGDSVAFVLRLCTIGT